jgi:hypothetical protein
MQRMFNPLTGPAPYFPVVVFEQGKPFRPRKKYELGWLEALLYLLVLGVILASVFFQLSIDWQSAITTLSLYNWVFAPKNEYKHRWGKHLCGD